MHSTRRHHRYSAVQAPGSINCSPHVSSSSRLNENEPQPARPYKSGRSLLVPLKAEACVDPLFLGGEKYGKNGATEGGWFVCAEGFKDAPAGSCIVYSMGVNDDWSFDKAASDKYGCQVHGFDPSDAGLASMKAYTTGSDLRKYHIWGVGGKDGDYAVGTVPFRWPGIGYLTLSNNMPWSLKTVSSTMKELQHAAITLLKMDVEGAEWFAIEDLVNSKIIDGRGALQFAAELHFDPKRYIISMDEPSKGFRVTQTADDDMDYIGLLSTLIDQGLTMWKWNFNSYDSNCVEVSFIVTK